MIGDNIPSWQKWLFVTVGVLDFALVVYNFGIGAAFKWLFIGALVWAWLVTWAGLVNKGAKQAHQGVATGIVLIGAGLFLGIVLGNLLSPTATKTSTGFSKQPFDEAHAQLKAMAVYVWSKL